MKWMRETLGGLGGMMGWAFIVVVPAIGALISLSVILWFFGIRDSAWPPWPMQTQCEKQFEKYEDVLIDDGENVRGPAPIMLELEAHGCMDLN